MTMKTAIKATLASVTDALAAAGSKIPAIAQLTITHAGTSVTLTPAAPVQVAPPPAPPVCPHCGK
jgi:hypothetical protein